MTIEPAPIEIPAGCLVLLIGAAGAGKSTFAAKHFPLESVLSTDQLRTALKSTSGEWVGEAVVDQLLGLTEERLAAGSLTVIDATNTDWMRRAELIRRARRHQRPVVAIVFDLPEELCLARNRSRSHRVLPSVVRRQIQEVHRDLDRLDLEGCAAVYVFSSIEDVDRVKVEMKKGPVTRALSS